MGKKIYILLVLTLLCLQKYIVAQDQHRNFEHFSIQDGLSQSIVKCIHQDRDGFIWIGTQDGLNQYDGYHFRVYRHEPLDTNTISSNHIQAIIEDKQGNLWIGTQEGLNKLDKTTGEFTIYYNDHNYLKKDDIFALCQDNKGLIWIKTLEIISKFDPLTEQFVAHYTHQSIDPFNATHQFSVIEDSYNTVWIASNRGLHYYSEVQNQLLRYTNNAKDPKSISNDQIRVIFEDSKKNLWIGTENGLNRFNRRQQNFDRYYHQEKDILHRYRPNKIGAIAEDKNGRLWIGSDVGLSYFDPKDEIIKYYSQNYITYREINKISSIIVDRSNILWVGTLDGLFKVDLKKKKFRLYRKPDCRNTMLKNCRPDFSGNNVRSIFVDEQNRIWFGTRHNGLNIFNREDGTVEYQKFRNQSTERQQANHIQVLYKDRHDTLWIGTNNGVFIFNPKNKQFEQFFAKKNPEFDVYFEFNRVNTILHDTDNRLWFGTKFGLLRYDKNTNHDTVFRYNETDKNSISSDEVFCVLQTRDKTLWIGTLIGLNHYIPEKNHFEKFIKGQGQLSHNSVLSLYESPDSILWIGTESGLNRYNPRLDTFQYFTQKQGFHNDYIYSIIPDKNQNLWISTNKGIARFNPNDYSIKNYGVIDGLQGYEYNLGAYYKSPEGEILFGGINGLNAFYPDSITPNKFVPQTTIISIERRNKDGKKIKTYIKGNNHFEFDYQSFDFTIEFAVLEFTHPERNKYAYHMENINDEWIFLNEQNTANFPRIPPGEYIFRVRGSNCDGIWNDTPTELYITITPPFWQTIYAYFLYAILLMLSIYLFMFFVTKNLRRARQLLKERENAAREIERQKEELAIKNENITDSINYARRIIEAMMPSVRHFTEILPESFILYLPKDIVSGDFYWITEKNDKIFVAAVDCTGHGVPGAFMSIIGFDLLRNIIDDQEIEKPSEILDRLSFGVAKTFGGGIEGSVKDGMDLAFCVIDRKKKILEYAGAFNPLYLVRDNYIYDYKADRFSVGVAGSQENRSFTNREIPLQKGDTIYLFSDGYADQFGGPKGKKFKHRRFRHLLLTISNLSMEQQYQAVLRSIEQWKGDLDQVDDILLIGMRPL